MSFAGKFSGRQGTPKRKASAARKATGTHRAKASAHVGYPAKRGKETYPKGKPGESISRGRGAAAGKARKRQQKIKRGR